VPAVLVIAIGIVSAVVLARNGEAGNRPLEVEAVGQQFAWKFVYSDYDDLTSGELVLPVGRETRFTMRALDVIHSFWVPNFGQKMDAVPGIENKILVTPKRVGEFAVVCAELCGLGHATMRAKARVVTPAEFEQWIEENRSA
jgi:cytochrome c oxidase subunit 2